LKNKKFGYGGALLIGASFAFDWTACIEPILGGILAYAGTLENANNGIILLLIHIRKIQSLYPVFYHPF
jgi:cytochrome c-type biogenesis protein